MADDENSPELSDTLEQRVRRQIRVAEWAAALYRRLLWMHWRKVAPPFKWLAPGSEQLPIERENVSFDSDGDPP